MRPLNSSTLALACLALLACTPAVAIAADRWQYATLTATGTFTWRAGEQTLTASTVQQFPQFFQQVTGAAWTAGRPDLGEDTVARLLDGLGAAGWEMVQVTTDGNARVYYFKKKL